MNSGSSSRCWWTIARSVRGAPSLPPWPGGWDPLITFDEDEYFHEHLVRDDGNDNINDEDGIGGGQCVRSTAGPLGMIQTEDDIL